MRTLRKVLLGLGVSVNGCVLVFSGLGSLVFEMCFFCL